MAYGLCRLLFFQFWQGDKSNEVAIWMPCRRFPLDLSGASM